MKKYRKQPQGPPPSYQNLKEEKKKIAAPLKKGPVAPPHLL